MPSGTAVFCFVFFISAHTSVLLNFLHLSHLNGHPTQINRPLEEENPINIIMPLNISCVCLRHRPNFLEVLTGHGFLNLIKFFRLQPEGSEIFESWTQYTWTQRIPSACFRYQRETSHYPNKILPFGNLKEANNRIFCRWSWRVYSKKSLNWRDLKKFILLQIMFGLQTLETLFRAFVCHQCLIELASEFKFYRPTFLSERDCVRIIHLSWRPIKRTGTNQDKNKTHL